MPLFKRDPAPGEQTRATRKADQEAAAFRRGRTSSGRGAARHAEQSESPFRAARRASRGRGRS
jgi:hypothetical protein